MILLSLLLSLVAQLNIWRVLCYAGLRGQDAANRLLNGLGVRARRADRAGRRGKAARARQRAQRSDSAADARRVPDRREEQKDHGEDYRHPVWLWVLGLIAALASAWVGVTSLGTLADLFK